MTKLLLIIYLFYTYFYEKTNFKVNDLNVSICNTF